jgi:hypothetical protein
MYISTKVEVELATSIFRGFVVPYWRRRQQVLRILHTIYQTTIIKILKLVRWGLGQYLDYLLNFTDRQGKKFTFKYTHLSCIFCSLRAHNYS